MKEKKLKLITQILAILVICLISFVGIYKQEANRMENKVKGYELEKDLTGYREFIFKVSDATEVTDADGKVVGNTDDYSDTTIESNSYKKTENKINLSENLTEDNFNKTKQIIEERLKNLNIENYNISVNNENGEVYLQIPENSETDHIASNILQVADFKIKDSEDLSKVFITNNDVKKVSSVYNTTESGTTVYLKIDLNKNGKEILKNLSTDGEYVTKEESNEKSEETTNADNNEVQAQAQVSAEENTPEENNSEEENIVSEDKKEESEESKQKKIAIVIDKNEMVTTSFDEPMTDGSIYLTMGQASKDADTVSKSLKSTSTIATVLNSGKMPITYKIAQNQYVQVDSSNTIKYVVYAFIIIVLILLVFLIIKFRLKGILAVLAYIGFVAIDLLLVRYTNVEISIESIVASGLILGINYMLTYKLLEIKDVDKELRKIKYKKLLKNTIINLIPLFIISIIFVFIKWMPIATFGMFMFWGIVLSIMYNHILTRDMLD